jgi:hypothetical protein
MEHTAYDGPTEDLVQRLLPQHVKRARLHARQPRREDRLAEAGSHLRGTRTHAVEAVQAICRDLAAGRPAPAPSQCGSQPIVAGRLRDRHFRDRHELRLHPSRAFRHRVPARLRRVAVSDQAARARRGPRWCTPASPGRVARETRAAGCALPDRDAAGGTRNPGSDGTPGRNVVAHAHCQRYSSAPIPRSVVQRTAAAGWRHPVCPDGSPEAG